MRRVAVTGLGCVSPSGADVALTWENIKMGVRAIRTPLRFSPEELGIFASAECIDFDAGKYLNKREEKRLDRFGVLNISAATQAVDDSGILDAGYDLNTIAVVSGVGMGGIATLVDEHSKVLEKGYRAISPFCVPKTIINLASSMISIKYGFCGPSYCVVTACASSTDAIGNAFTLIKTGKAIAAVAGGAEAAVEPFSIAGFARMQALSASPPEVACRPFDKERNGFVMGEGAAYLVLEDMESALNRGVKIYAEIAGYGQTCDAYHITAPHPDCTGAMGAMGQAIGESGLATEDIDYINAHGTSTPLNDLIETRAIKKTFGEQASKNLLVSSTKSMTGHLLGAAGALEALLTVLSVRDDFAPPTITTENLEDECDLDYVLSSGKSREIRAALSNSFGFGGHNACLLIKKP